MECLFCKIVNKEIPKEFLHEDEKVLAFYDIHPKAPTHILIIPREHIESIVHLKEEQGDILVKIFSTAKNIAENHKLKGYKLILNVGKEGGQVIDHLHLHLLGGWSNKEERSINV
ncbi:MAG: Hit-like protein involved in cell-cycle regulation [Parcubacteria group bacterium Gr01-1014_33]|nr:MAG: Hit-like protein involved in cell-cycle regulation [Parcubacteria group bacterium Gr01-1014_33]